MAATHEATTAIEAVANVADEVLIGLMTGAPVGASPAVGVVPSGEGVTGALGEVGELGATTAGARDGISEGISDGISDGTSEGMSDDIF